VVYAAVQDGVSMVKVRWCRVTAGLGAVDIGVPPERVGADEADRHNPGFWAWLRGRRRWDDGE
jgi:hypothetical protein